MYLFRINKKVVLRVCGKKKKQQNKQKKENYSPPSCFYFMFWFSTFLFFWWCMYVYDYQWVRMYVCKWLILYIWCSLRWKSGRCPGLILFFFLLFRPCTVPVGVSDNYAREWFSDCWMWFYWERSSSVDWLFVRVNLKKKKRPYYLIFSVVKSLSRSGRVEPWFYGEALPGCCCIWVGFFIF